MPWWVMALTALTLLALWALATIRDQSPTPGGGNGTHTEVAEEERPAEEEEVIYLDEESSVGTARRPGDASQP